MPVSAPIRLRLRAILVAVAVTGAALGTASAAAQTVVGTVAERGSARPVAGAFIVLEAEDGRRLNGVLSDESGGYVLRGSAPGRYRLVAELIGYASTTTDWIDLAAGASVRRDIEVSVEAVSLDAIQVETGQRCRRRPGSGPETARLWEEARKALEVARWSEGQGLLRFSVVQHRRELDASTLRVLAQIEKPKSGLYDRSPFRSIPAARLARGGYIQLAADNRYDYFAPDAEVLLSDSFLETHCFRVMAPPRGEPELIGLGFEPVPERDLPDVSGVLWLDRGSAELKRLDYRYRALPFRHGDWPHVGGTVEFERLATGMWIVRRWQIRMPMRAQEVGGYGGAARDLDLLTLSEEGAEVRSVSTRDGTLIAEALGATVYGTVTTGDDGSGEGLPGATVRLAATEHRTTAGDDGAFRLTGLPAGTFAVHVTHPALTGTGIGPLEATVALQSGRATRLVVSARLTPAAAREICQGRGWSASAGSDPTLVYGTVTASDGETGVADALVRVWGGGGPERRVVADSTGVFRFCTDASVPLRLAAVDPSQALASRNVLDLVDVESAAPGFVRADISLSRPVRVSGASAGRVYTWSNAIIGRVLEEGTERAIEGAMVVLTAADGSVAASMVTDGEGRFKLLHPTAKEERFTLEVRHVAYGTMQSPVLFPPGEELRLDFVVSPRAIDLEPVVVTERRRGFLADQGFYQRLERGGGIYIQREEIERRMPTKITDLLQGRSGVRVITNGRFSDVRMIQQISIRVDAGECRPSIWIDGMMARPGGPGKPGGTELMLSDVVSPEHVEAMELYTGPAATPAQFGGTDSPCGAVVIWTRRD